LFFLGVVFNPTSLLVWDVFEVLDRTAEISSR
jgi:hypothetical protein